LEFCVSARRRFQLVLIKPSHYDDDGYVIRWWRAMIPSNSLAALYGIAADCAERHVLGPGVAITIDAIDETHTRVKVPALLARFRRHGNFGLVALIGVQSNQYPRALDIARPFRRVGICATRQRASLQRRTISLRIFRESKARRCRFFPSSMWSEPSATIRVSMPAEAARTSAHSARLSTYKAASHAIVRLTMWSA
jgi:hypothetical protein